MKFFSRSVTKKEPSQQTTGEGNVVAGNDIINNFGLMNQGLDLYEIFAHIDSNIKKSVGDPTSPTAEGAKMPFSSAKLFSSLIQIGMMPDVTFQIVKGIQPYIEDELKTADIPFSTSHIRKAVSIAILETPDISLVGTERRRIANKYARNYGDPKQTIMVVYEDNNEARPLNFPFLEKVFLPELAVSLTGYDPNELKKSLLSRSNIDHMTNEILSAVRRMGIYQVRHETLVKISEDLALQPPHPWFVNEWNRHQTILHDRERANKHFSNLKPGVQEDILFWRYSAECLNHICSSILASYESIIGGGVNAAPNTLRNFTRLSASENHSNIVLWDFCEIHQFSDHLSEIDYCITDFHYDLKDTQKSIDRMRELEKYKTTRNLRKFLSVMNHVNGRTGFNDSLPKE